MLGRGRGQGSRRTLDSSHLGPCSHAQAEAGVRLGAAAWVSGLEMRIQVLASRPCSHVGISPCASLEQGQLPFRPEVRVACPPSLRMSCWLGCVRLTGSSISWPSPCSGVAPSTLPGSLCSCLCSPIVGPRTQSGKCCLSVHVHEL